MDDVTNLYILNCIVEFIETMGSQTPAGNDRSRTYWTPTMECYFIDLMLEHMHRGNRTGHTFNKQAWTEMISMFNAKFTSQYDKDVLKSRYTSLWKQFNDIKNLLGQNGFSWDEARQMVVADDYVWDAYIKTHPDARPYKTKAVPNFNDLCLIYGYTTADGSERSRTDWTAAMDQYFIELMLNQLEGGNKLDNTFSKQAWTDMLTLFNSKFGQQHSKRVLRHRYKKLWKYYNDVTSLLKQNGFSWDDSQQMVVGGDDLWDAYGKAHPHARPYRKRVLPNYKDLAVVFGNAMSNGIQSDLLQDKGVEDDIKAGGERSRTYWTPPMDRCFIDLLQDQVHKGNRIGQTFISQAWIDMVKSFNAKFKSHYDKDVLKNRYKHLRKQYNDVKILLEQNEFAWDETREMVTAADHVWDAYTEAHPDARSYRVKTIPSYNKLCAIYGQDSCDRRYSRWACNDPESEVPLLMIAEEKDDQSPASANPTFNWTLQMHMYLIDLLLEQIRARNEISHTFDEQDWAFINVSFSEKFGVQFDTHMLENQYMNLMKEYNDISSLLDQNEFAWDETLQIIVADDDVWEAYIKEHPDAVTYRNKIIGYFNDLCILFGSGIANGGLSCQVPGMEFDDVALDIKMDEISGYVQICTDIDDSDEGKKRPIAVPSASGRSSKVQKTCYEVREPSSDKTGIFAKLVNKKEEKSYVSIENAIDALQAISDIDDELLLDACDLLEDERKAKTFLALDVNLRKKWLLRKLGR
ncbi:hypothetical protein RHMOL_Rhmol02G0269400 [Rhododendron molle]|uniref:Uncharacterized protein n=1 Tax=Rhododendron molle TaxID=49168 RepID=A0ACC0PUD9_RHOML|nr:hypothetical protein RHMOL_Rhmol02G0269400 [Rhododendron molle]